MKALNALVTLAAFVTTSHALADRPASCDTNVRMWTLCNKDYMIQTGEFQKLAKQVKADPKRYMMTGLHFMAEYNAVPEAAALLAAGADINAISGNSYHGGTALNMAVNDTQVEMVDFLLAHGADVNVHAERGNTAIFQAIFPEAMTNLQPDRVAQAQVFDLLIKAKPNLDLTNEMGGYPLCGAATWPELRKRLIAAGANPNLHVPNYVGPLTDKYLKAKTWWSEPALICAVSPGGYRQASNDVMNDAVIDLLAAGAKVDSRGRYYDTPLMELAAASDLEGIKILLTAGANANLKNNFGQNALMLSIAQLASPEVVETLLPLTDLSKKDIYGRTYKDYLAGKMRPNEQTRWYHVEKNVGPVRTSAIRKGVNDPRLDAIREVFKRVGKL